MKTVFSVFLTVIVLTGSCDFIREKGWFGKSKADPKTVSLAMQDSIRIADSMRAEREKMQALEQARLDSIQAAEQAQREWEARLKYHIIVGSFLTRGYADEYLEYYKSMGYNAEIIKDHNDRFNLISAEKHDNMNQAIRRLHQYQDTVEFESWLYIDE